MVCNLHADFNMNKIINKQGSPHLQKIGRLDFSLQRIIPLSEQFKILIKLEKRYAPALDKYGQSYFVRSDFLKMKCVCKTQMMPPPDHQNPVDMHTSIMCINIQQNIKAVAPKL
jgi:hypothetical protein